MNGAGGAGTMATVMPSSSGACGAKSRTAGQHLGGVVEWPEDRSAEHHRADGVDSVFESCGNAEVAAATAQTPEQVRFGVGVGVDEFAVGGDQIDRHQVVDGQAVLAHEVTEAAAQGQPADAGVADDTAGGSQTVGLSGAVELAPQHPAGRGGPLRLLVDADCLHERQVDHQPVLAHGQTLNRVAAATDRNFQLVAAGEAHGTDHVVGARTTRDEPPVGGRPLRSIPVAPRRIPPRRGAAALPGNRSGAR